MINRTWNPSSIEIGHQALGGALVEALAGRQDVNLVEQSEQGGRGLVHGAYDGAARVRQALA